MIQILVGVLLARANYDVHEGLPKLPTFDDYRIASIYKGPHRPIDMKQLEKDIDYPAKRNIQYSTSRKVNFAGSWVLSSASCGTSCQRMVGYDARTGRYALLDQMIRFNYLSNEDIGKTSDFRAGSSLLVVHGGLFLAENCIPFGDHYYSFDGKSFHHLYSVLNQPPSMKARKALRRCWTYNNPISRTLTGNSGTHTFSMHLAQKFVTQTDQDWDHSIDGHPVTVTTKRKASFLSMFEVAVDGRPWQIPSSLWRDCVSPNFGVWPRSRDRADTAFVSASLSADGKTLKLQMDCGYDYSACVVTWTLNSNGKHTRTTEGAFEHAEMADR